MLHRRDFEGAAAKDVAASSAERRGGVSVEQLGAGGDVRLLSGGPDLVEFLAHLMGLKHFLIDQ